MVLPGLGMELEDKGLVVQRMVAHDRRARAIEVTGPGAALAQRAITVVEQVDADFFRHAPDSLTPALQALAGLAGDEARRLSPDG